MSSVGMYMRWSVSEISNISIISVTPPSFPMENRIALGSVSTVSSSLQMMMLLFSRYILRISLKCNLFWLYLHDMCVRDILIGIAGQI